MGFNKKHIIIIFRKSGLFSSGSNPNVFQWCYILWLNYYSYLTYPQNFILLYCLYAQCNSPLFITMNLKYRQKYAWYAKNLELWQNYFRQYYIDHHFSFLSFTYRNEYILEFLSVYNRLLWLSLDNRYFLLYCISVETKYWLFIMDI